MSPAVLTAAPGAELAGPDVAALVARGLAGMDLDGASLCVVVPDATRSCPLPALLDAVHAAVGHRVARTTVLVALGTHAPLGEEALAAHLGHPPGDAGARWPGTTVVQHAWWEPSTFARLGRIDGARVAELSGGLLRDPVEVRLNRAVVEHDAVLVLGPVFPHEVVGFSGGTKYLVPGVAAAEVIDATHWLGALITSRDIIGTLGTTPVRAMVDEAAAMVPAAVGAVCVVVAPGGALVAAAVGEPRAAWAAAAQASSRTHVTHLDAPVRRVLSIVPARYEDLWTGAKGFYKVEPVVADGGEVVLWAPHITELSAVHPEIARIGYHCRDWFTARWEEHRHLPWGVLAHSTHLRGAGTYDAASGVEHPRVRVVLASAVPRGVVEGAGLGWLDPADVDRASFEADPDALVVPDAGEVLHRLRPAPRP